MIIQCSRTFCPPNTWVFPTYDSADNVTVAPDWDFDFEDYTVDISADMRAYTFVKTPDGHVYRITGCRAVTEEGAQSPTVLYCRVALTPAAWLWREPRYTGDLLESSNIYPTSSVTGCITGVAARKISGLTTFDLIVTVQGADFVRTYAVQGVTTMVLYKADGSSMPYESHDTDIGAFYASQGLALSFGKIDGDGYNLTYDKIVGAYLIPRQGFDYSAAKFFIYGTAEPKDNEKVARYSMIELPDYSHITTNYTGEAKTPCIIGAALEAHEYSPGVHAFKFSVHVAGRVQLVAEVDGDARDVTEFFTVAIPVKGDAAWWAQNGLSTNISIWSGLITGGISLGSGNVIGAAMTTANLVAAVDKLNAPKGLNYSPAGSGVLNALRGFIRFDEIGYQGVARDDNGAYTTNGQAFTCAEVKTISDGGRTFPEYVRGRFSPVVPGSAVVDRAVCEELAGGVWIKWR